MRVRRHSILLTVLTQYLLLLLVANLGPVLIGEFLRLLLSAACACLLVFVAVHSARICKALLARFQAIACFFLASVGDTCRARLTNTVVLLPSEPSLAAAFQRPPPAFSY
jgi:hypothetical protein